MANCPVCKKSVSIWNHYFNFQNFRENMSRMGIKKVYNCDKCNNRFLVNSTSALWLNSIVMGLIFVFFVMPSYILMHNRKIENESILTAMIVLASLSLIVLFAGYFIWWKYAAKLEPFNE